MPHWMHEDLPVTKLRLVVFDCDGVLFESREANRMYYNSLLEQFGRPPMTEEELEYVHTHNAVLSTAHIFRHRPGEGEKAEDYRATVDYEPFLKHMKMEEGLPSFLASLERAGLKRAISTNRTTTMSAVLEMAGLGESFDIVVTALDVDHPKPHPEALRKILDHFGLLAEEGIFIGDSSVDVDHAAAVGMKIIAFRNERLRADFHAGSFREVAALPPFAGIIGGKD